MYVGVASILRALIWPNPELLLGQTPLPYALYPWSHESWPCFLFLPFLPTHISCSRYLMAASDQVTESRRRLTNMKSISDHHEKESRVKRNSYHNVNIILSYLVRPPSPSSDSRDGLSMNRGGSLDVIMICTPYMHTEGMRSACQYRMRCFRALSKQYIPSHLEVRSK
jgi:hypothetical protein